MRHVLIGLGNNLTKAYRLYCHKNRSNIDLVGNMKKIHNKEYLIKASYRKYQNQLKRQNKKYDTNKDLRPKIIAGKRKIPAPAIISFYGVKKNPTNFINTINFINNIKKTLSKEDCIIDFQNTKRISAAAAVALYAEIENIKRYNFKSSLIWPTSSPSTVKFLKRIGLAKLIKHGASRNTFKDLHSLPIVSSIRNNLMDDIIDFIQNKIHPNMAPDTEHVYGDAVSETINNVTRHAYPDQVAEDKRWWLLCDIIDKQLYLAIYDIGVGIPATIVRKSWFNNSVKKNYPEAYKSLLKEKVEIGKTNPIFKVLKDPELIYISMQGDTSSTKKDEHGQGSKSIRALVEETPRGLLWIFSNKGLYKFNEDKEHPELIALPKRLSGTLVQWNIKIA